MPRKKPLNVFPVKSVNDANGVLAQIGGIQRDLSAIEAKMNADIDQMKAQARAEAAPLEEKLQGLENGLQAFSEYRKEDLFAKKRTIDLNFGKFGFRKATRLKPMAKNTWKKVLEILKDKGLVSAIRVKESPNKDILGEWSDDRLAGVNVKRVVQDQFWYEVDEEQLKGGEA